MSTFVQTGYHPETFTTTDDPMLSIVECDNGLTWDIRFYCGGTLIDLIPMEHPHYTIESINSLVLDLPVTDYHEENIIGTVRDRIQYSWKRHVFVNHVEYLSQCNHLQNS